MYKCVFIYKFARPKPRNFIRTKNRIEINMVNKSALFFGANI